jgi:hypothetical protein
MYAQVEYLVRSGEMILLFGLESIIVRLLSAAVGHGRNLRKEQREYREVGNFSPRFSVLLQRQKW